MTEPDDLSIRCANGVGCHEILDRLRASDAARAAGYPAEAERLRLAAARWAEVHQHGAPERLEAAG